MTINLNAGCNTIGSKDILPELVNNCVLFCLHLITDCQIILRSFSTFPLLVRQTDSFGTIEEELYNESLVHLKSFEGIELIPLSRDRCPCKNFFYFEQEEYVEEAVQAEEDRAVCLNLLPNDEEKVLVEAENDKAEIQNDIILARNESEDNKIISDTNCDTIPFSLAVNANNETEIKQYSHLDEQSHNKNDPSGNENDSSTYKLRKRKIILDEDENEIKLTKKKSATVLPLKLTRSSSNIVNFEQQKENTILLERKRKRNVVPKESPKQLPCSICLDPIRNKSQLDKCEHEFCRECIDQWAELSSTCPLCKVDFTKIVTWASNKKEETKVKRRRFKYEEEEEEPWYQNCAENCMVCSKNNDQHLLLVCDRCTYNICHTYCAGLDLIPDDEWLCDVCDPPKRKGNNNLNNFPSRNKISPSESGRRSTGKKEKLKLNQQQNRIQTRSKLRLNRKKKYNLRNK